MKRVLEVFRDSSKPVVSYLKIPLQDGDEGNLQTLEEMKRIVLEDREEPDLRNFVLREIVGNVAGHDAKGEIEAIFNYAQKRIVYRKDPVGVERVADIWSTMYGLNPNQPEGDCGIKSVFLASCLALLGYQTCFLVLRDNPNVNNFSHVYVGLLNESGYTSLDPTPIDEPLGYEAPAIERARFEIFK